MKKHVPRSGGTSRKRGESVGKYYAFVGSWSMKPGPKGIGIYEYNPETADLTFVRTIHEESSVGNQYYDAGSRILYTTDEGANVPGTAAGRILTFRTDPEAGLVDLGAFPTVLPKPSAVCKDTEGNCLLVSHHSNRGAVTQAVRREDGTWTSRTVSDEAALALLSLDAEGKPEKILDCVITRGEDPYGTRHMLSHMHDVTPDPSGELYLVCDKGMDCIYSFRLDRKARRLRLLRTTQAPEDSAPRYIVFHPTLPVLFENNERRPLLLTYRYDTEGGALELLDEISFAEDSGAPQVSSSAPGDGFGLRGLTIQPSALVIHPDGKTLYSSFRGTNTIVVLRIDESGIPHPVQTVDCGGVNPRGLCLSPDGRFLFSANIESGSIARFFVAADGTLLPAGEPMPAHMPANIVIAET